MDLLSLEEYKRNFNEYSSDDNMSDWSYDDDEEATIDRVFNDNNNSGGFNDEAFQIDSTKVNHQPHHDQHTFNYDKMFDEGDEDFITNDVSEDLFYTINFDTTRLITSHLPFTHFPHEHLFEHYTLFKITQTPPLGNIRIASPPCTKVIRQNDLIREIFSMLRGFQGSIFKIVNDNFELSDSELSVSFLSRSALHNSLKYFIKISNKLRKIHSNATRSIRFVKSTIIESCHSSILQIIEKIRDELSEMEKRNQMGTKFGDMANLSLLSLRTSLFVYEQKIHTLSILDEEIEEILDREDSQSNLISDLISHFYEKVLKRQYISMDSNNDEYDYSLKILMAILKPYLSITDNWIFEGTIQDKHNEFLLKRNEMVDLGTPLFWNEGFTESKVSTLLSKIKDKISATGKSIIIVRDIEQKYEIAANDSSIGDYLLDKEKPSLYNLLCYSLGLENEHYSLYYNDDEEAIISPLRPLNSFRTSKKRESQSPTSQTALVAPIGSLHSLRSPPKKKRMISLLEKEDLYSNILQTNDPNQYEKSLFFELSNENKSQQEKLTSIFKKKSLFDVLDLPSLEKDQKLQTLPLEIIFNIGISSHIEEQYNRVSPYLCDLLVNRCKLLDHLTALRAFYLMEAGDIMDYFATKLFNLSDRFFQFGFRGVTTFDLQVILKDALRLGIEFPRRYSFATDNSTSIYTTDIFSSLKLDNIISVHFDDSITNKQNSEESNFFDAVTFNYELEWPLNLIISSQHIQSYNEVLIFNLKLKQAKQVLDKMSLKTDAFTHKSNAYLKFYSLLNQLKHFIGTVQYYMMNRILHTLWNELCENILSAKNLDDLQSFHLDYLNKIKDRFLLKKALFVKNHIFKVVQMCLTLRIKLSNFKETQREDIFIPELEEMESEFRKSFKMLLTIINSILATRGIHDHLDDLRIRLNFNNFYN